MRDFYVLSFLNTTIADLIKMKSNNVTEKAASNINPTRTITASTINRLRIVCILTVHFFLPLFKFCGDRAEYDAKNECACNNKECFHSFLSFPRLASRQYAA